MKLFSIIKKNLRLLLRNKVSNFVLILSPLLIIFLVGISFSTSSFSIKVSVFSEGYSPLSESLIKVLLDDNYFILRENSLNDCINSVSEGISQACILFPENMKISNDEQQLIKLYVDQSKVNIAYLVLATLRESLGQKTTELSKELTDKLISTISFTKEKINSLNQKTKSIDELTIETINLGNKSADSILLLDFNPSSNAEINTDNIKSITTELLSDSLSLITSSKSLINSLDDWVMPNGTTYLNTLENNIDSLNSRLTTGEENINQELMKFDEDLDLTISEFTEKLDYAKKINLEVYNNLLKAIENLNKIKENNNLIKETLNNVINNIDSIEILNSERITNPIITEIYPVVKETTNLGFLFPSLISLLIMFTGIFLTSILVIMEKNSRAYFRVFITPNKNRLFVFATYLTSLLIILIQLLIIFIVSYYYFKIQSSFAFNEFLIFLLSSIIIITFFIFLGLLIGYIFNSEEIAMLASLSIVTLFLLTSGVIFPLESMPPYIINIAKYNPMYISTEIIKKAILFSFNFLSIQPYLQILLIYSLIISIVILIIKKYSIIKYYIKKFLDKKRQS